MFLSSKVNDDTSKTVPYIQGVELSDWCTLSYDVTNFTPAIKWLIAHSILELL